MSNFRSVEETVSKQSFRKEVWDHFEKTKLTSFPSPPHGRIPNFVGAKEAAAQLLDLDEFKTAKCVEVNPDKPLEPSRVLVIENSKILYVPIPKLQDGLLKKLSFCDEDRPENVKQAVTRWGLDTLAKTVDFTDKIHIDLFVLGSVAVSKNGRRIGKGKGFADLEYAILKEMGAIDQDTVIVTTVHDSQVFYFMISIHLFFLQKHLVFIFYYLQILKKVCFSSIHTDKMIKSTSFE